MCRTAARISPTSYRAARPTRRFYEKHNISLRQTPAGGGGGMKDPRPLLWHTVLRLLETDPHSWSFEKHTAIYDGKSHIQIWTSNRPYADLTIWPSDNFRCPWLLRSRIRRAMANAIARQMEASK